MGLLVVVALKAQGWWAVPVSLLWGIVFLDDFRDRGHISPPDIDAHCCTFYTYLAPHIFLDYFPMPMMTGLPQCLEPVPIRVTVLECRPAVIIGMKLSRVFVGQR